MDAAGSSSSKRKRVSRACDQCFSKKDKCDGTHPRCSICSRIGRECTYDRPERKRGPMQGVRQKLEAEVETLESVLGILIRRCPDLAGIRQELDASRDEARAAWRKSLVRKQILGLEPPEKQQRLDILINQSDPEDSSDEGEDGVSVQSTAVAPSTHTGTRSRGLVPRGTDPNDALGGFELEFQHVEDRWISGVLGATKKQHLPPPPSFGKGKKK